jgi:hypothetical protein
MESEGARNQPAGAGASANDGFATLDDLLKHLDRVGGDAAVVVALRSSSAGELPSPNETQRLASQLIARAEDATGQRIARSNVFKRLGRFVIEAPAAAIRFVAAQPEVTETTPNKLQGLGLIEPVRKTPVKGW